MVMLTYIFIYAFSIRVSIDYLNYLDFLSTFRLNARSPFVIKANESVLAESMSFILNIDEHIWPFFALTHKKTVKCTQLQISRLNDWLLSEISVRLQSSNDLKLFSH